MSDKLFRKKDIGLNKILNPRWGRGFGYCLVVSINCKSAVSGVKLQNIMIRQRWREHLARVQIVK